MRSASKFVTGLIISLSFPLPQCAQRPITTPDQALFEAANHERTSRGLPPLQWDTSLAATAKQHALRMARQNLLSHQFPGEPDFATRARNAGALFSAAAENVAEGPNADSIHRQWMNSPPHRQNLLDPDLDSIGVATADRNGQLFAVEDFSHALPKLSFEDVEEKLNAQLRTRGLRLLGIVDVARQTCALDQGYAGSQPPSFLIRYSTPDPSVLPKLLEQKIRSGGYHSAVAGACTPPSQTGFGGYRVAVLLYE